MRIESIGRRGQPLAQQRDRMRDVRDKTGPAGFQASLEFFSHSGKNETKVEERTLTRVSRLGGGKEEKKRKKGEHGTQRQCTTATNYNP